jgi:hypothetical protein
MAAVEALPGWTWDPTADTTVAFLGALSKFAAREGHARVPAKHSEGELHLGSWVAQRRVDYRDGTLDPFLVERLEAVAGWQWNPRDDDWDRGNASLSRFVAREGHARVPPRHIEGDFRLGSWVLVRRADFRAGRLPPERVASLAGLPGWSWEPRGDDWARAIEALDAFVAREGHARVPRGTIESGSRLGNWVTSRRVEYRHGRLAPERIAELEAIMGWTWDPDAEDWADAMAALRAFAAREGHTRVPAQHIERGFRLGAWVSNRRNRSRRTTIPPEQIAELEALPGWTWDPEGDDWATAMAALHAFIDREGHGRVPRLHREGSYNLGLWVANRRARADRLSPAARAELEALSGWTWDPLGDDWARAMRELGTFIKREGHSRVPSHHVERGFRLGAWVNNNRYRYRQGKLDPEHAEALATLPGWSWGR